MTPNDSEIAVEEMHILLLLMIYLLNFVCHFKFDGYPEDMGPLRPKEIRNLGLRDKPLVETRVGDYSEFLSKEGDLQSGEVIITCVRSGGIALITSLPEKLSRKCKRQGVSYKLGDIVVVGDMLSKMSDEESVDVTAIVGTTKYVKNSSNKMLQRTILLSDLILPADLHDITRSQLLRCESHKVQKAGKLLDVYILQLSDIESLRELESEMFCSVAD